MLAALRAEWVRIGRVSYLATAVGVTAAISVLFTVLTVVNSTSTSSGSRPGDQTVTPAALSAADGSTLGVVNATNLIGVVALCLFASAFAADYSSGVMRNLLVRHPRRASLLVGKFGALAALGALIVVVALATGIVAAYLAAPSAVSTTAWLSGAGVAAIASAAVNLLAAMLGFGLVGAALGSLLRKATPAIAIGVAWMLPIEQILASTLSHAKTWLPGQLLEALAQGGTSTIGYATATGVISLYAVVGVTVALQLFQRRDVTA